MPLTGFEVVKLNLAKFVANNNCQEIPNSNFFKQCRESPFFIKSGNKIDFQNTERVVKILNYINEQNKKTPSDLILEIQDNLEKSFHDEDFEKYNALILGLLTIQNLDKTTQKQKQEIDNFLKTTKHFELSKEKKELEEELIKIKNKISFNENLKTKYETSINQNIDNLLIGSYLDENGGKQPIDTTYKDLDFNDIVLVTNLQNFLKIEQLYNSNINDKLLEQICLEFELFTKNEHLGNKKMQILGDLFKNFENIDDNNMLKNPNKKNIIDFNNKLLNFKKCFLIVKNIIDKNFIKIINDPKKEKIINNFLDKISKNNMYVIDQKLKFAGFDESFRVNNRNHGQGDDKGSVETRVKKYEDRKTKQLLNPITIKI